MKILHLSIIAILIFSTFLYLKPIQADNTNGVEIQNIQTLPTAIIVGQTFKINATLVNNSSNPIFVDHGSCEAPFSVTFDNHVTVNVNNINCTTEVILQKLNPGEKITTTSPGIDVVYRATESGTVNATVTFQYEIWNQNTQSNSKETISEPFSFTIYAKTHVPTLSRSANQELIDVATAIPGLQNWSHDWQYVSMGFMTAKNQPGNWQYAIVNLKASSNSSLIPCDNGWDAMVTIDRTTMKVISASYPTMEYHNCDNYATGGGPGLSVIPPKIESPLEQFKSGIAANNVVCNKGLELLIKAEDGSPTCVTSVTSQKLIERGWALNYTNTVDKESISLSAYQGVSNEAFYNNGTVVSDFTIDVNINNFKPSNASLVLQVYYDNGILYKTVSVSPDMIQPNGFYKYQLTAVSDENHPVPFKVVATYNKETAITYAPVFAHP